MRILLAIALMLAGFVDVRAADVVAASRRAYSYAVGTYVGVTGDIPSFSGMPEFDITAYGGVADGVTNNAPAITAAMNAAIASVGTGNAIIRIPAGTYALTGYSFPTANSNKFIVGTGMGLTILKPTSFTGISAKGSIRFDNPGNVKKVITGGLTAGSTSLQFADASGFVADRLAKVLLTNESETPIVNVYGTPQTRTLLVYITSVNTSTDVVTISRPIPFTYLSAATAGAELDQSPYTVTPRYYGIANLTIDCADTATWGVDLSATRDSFLYRVEVKRHRSRGIFVGPTMNTTLRECVVREGFLGGNNTSGIAFQESSYGYIDGCVAIINNPSIQVNIGTNVLVVANSYVDILKGNHGPHNSGNLYTDSAIRQFWQSDGYFGGSSHDIIDGNWMMSGILGSLKRFTRYTTFSRNIVGTPGQTYTSDNSLTWGEPARTGSAFYGNATPSTGDWWRSWDVATGGPRRITATLTTRTSATSGVFTTETGGGAHVQAHLDDAAAWNVTVNFGVQQTATIGNTTAVASSIVGDVITFTGFVGTLPVQGTVLALVPGYSGFSEFDHDVIGTSEKWLNYSVMLGGIPAGEANAGTIPTRFHMTTKPASYGALAWPPFNSASPGTPSIEDIPAGFFVANGYWPSDSAPTPSAPVITSALTKAGVVGVPLTYEITALHSPTSYSASGLPAGVAINTTTGVISGTPTTAGTPSATIGATNTEGSDSETLVFTIAAADSPPAINSALTKSGNVGVLLAYHITATNFPTAFTATGLPPGLTLNAETGFISGYPTTTGVFAATIGASNSDGSDSETLTFTITYLPVSISATDLIITGSLNIP